MIALRAGVKRAAEIALARFGPAAVARLRAKADTMVLAYHNIVPDGEEVAGDRSLHLPRAEFARQLDRLVETHDVVSLRDWRPGRPGGGGRGRPRAIVTFDDAYDGAVRCGVEELVLRGLPATIFVVAGRLGGHAFWWDRLCGPDGGGPAGDVRAYALAECAGRDATVESWALANGIRLRDPPGHARTATEEELSRAAGCRGITIGSHSWSHANLAALDPDELDEELSAAADWLEARFPSYVPWISYPYGLHSKETRIRAAKRYRGGFLIDGGWTPAPADPYAMPRTNIPAGASLAGFELRASGLARRRRP